MKKHLIIIPLALLFGALLFAAEINTVSVPVQKDAISVQTEELEKKQSEIDYLKSEVNRLKAGNMIQEAGIAGGLSSEIFLLGLSSLLAVALGITLMKKNKKPELCRCAKRREMLMQKRSEEQKLVSINNC